MNNILIYLLAKKIKIDGQTFLQPPEKGWRKSIFERLTANAFEKKYRNKDNFQISELDKTLEEVENQLTENAFQIDIYNGQINDLQIIHPILIIDKIQEERFEKFGFMIYITFDPTSEDYDKLHNNFKQLENYSSYFHFFHDDDIDCYALECGINKEKIIDNSSRILTKVLGYDLNSKYYFSISNHGKIKKTMPNTVQN